MKGLFTDSAITFSFRLSAAVVVYITQVLLARWMGVHALGEFVFAQACLWLLGSLATLGLGSAAHRFVPTAVEDGNLAAARGYVLWSQRVVLLSGVIAATLIVLGVTLWSHYSERSYLVLVLALTVVPISALTTLRSEQARSFLWFTFAAFTGTFLRPVLFLGVVAAAMYLGVSASSFNGVLLLVGVVLFVALVQSIALRRRLHPMLGSAEPAYAARTWLSVAVPVLLAETYNAFYIDWHVVVSGLFLSSSDLSVYNAALRTLAIVAFGASAIGLAVAPRAAKIYASGNLADLEALTRRATHLTLWPSIAAVALLGLAGKHVLRLFGDAFVTGYDAMMVAACAQLIFAFGGPLLPILRVTGHHIHALWGSLLALGATFGLNALLVPRLGLIGGSLSLVIVTALWTLWLYRIATVRLGVQPVVLLPAKHRAD